jgi:hypothetical protein
VTTNRASSPFGPIASAFALYLFLGAFNVLAAAVVPWLLELWERSPRLAALGWLGLIASPAGFVAMAHHATHALMDRFDVTGARQPGRLAQGLVPSLGSIRAGLFAWFVISFASMASALLFLAIFPPPPGEDTLSTLIHVATDFRLQATVHALLWVGVAALLYDVERRAKRA